MGQLALVMPCTWGGRREGAGRKRRGRPGVAHVARPAHVGRHPVHVTLRRASGVASLRRRDVFPSVRDAIAAASHDEFRVIHFSVQEDHVHLIVEANDREALSRGVQGLAIRVAHAVNRALHRRGRVWGERYHAHPLKTPRETRNAIRYVLLNRKKHAPWHRGTDPCSSVALPKSVRGPQTWLSRTARAPAAPESPKTNRQPNR